MPVSIAVRFGITYSFPCWVSRNSTILLSLATALQVPLHHIKRSGTYRGDQEELPLFPKSCQHDGATMLGLLLVLHTVVGHQNCKGDIQSACLRFLGQLFKLRAMHFKLPLIAGEEGIEIANGQVNVDQLKEFLHKDASLRRRSHPQGQLPSCETTATSQDGIAFRHAMIACYRPVDLAVFFCRSLSLLILLVLGGLAWPAFLTSPLACPRSVWPSWCSSRCGSLAVGSAMWTAHLCAGGVYMWWRSNSSSQSEKVPEQISWYPLKACRPFPGPPLHIEVFALR
jgi:hypothetical protein